MPLRRRVIPRRLVTVIVWSVATVLAGVVAWTAVSRLGSAGTATATRPLSAAEVHRRLDQAAAPEPTAPTRVRSAQGAASPTPTTPPSSRSWQLTGGTVGAACRGRAIELLYASPLDGWGYRLDAQTLSSISVEFSRGGTTAGLVARCVQGMPTRVAGAAQPATTGNEEGSGD